MPGKAQKTAGGDLGRSWAWLGEVSSQRSEVLPHQRRRANYALYNATCRLPALWSSHPGPCSHRGLIPPRDPFQKSILFASLCPTSPHIASSGLGRCPGTGPACDLSNNFHNSAVTKQKGPRWLPHSALMETPPLHPPTRDGRDSLGASQFLTPCSSYSLLPQCRRCFPAGEPRIRFADN